MVKNLLAKWEIWVLILGLGRPPGEGNSYPLQYSGLENSMDRGVWQATVQRVAKNWTQLSDVHSSHRGFPQDLTPPPEQRGLRVGAGLEGGQVRRGCVLSSPDGTKHPGGCPEVGSVQVGGQWRLVSQGSVSPCGQVPGSRGLLAGGKLALDALVPEQLVLADRGLQPGRSLQQVLHGEQQG